MEAHCGAGPVAVVGGGNSAGQAALFLARTCAAVHIIIRGETLAASMSRYLTERIERDPHIIVLTQTRVTGLTGTGRLEGVQLAIGSRSEESELAVTGLFVFIGAKPGTEWLAGQLAHDSHGFLLTGNDIPRARLADASQPPLLLETSRAGIFAVGDVRSGSVKRAATAVGEGSMAVRLVYERLQATGATAGESHQLYSREAEGVTLAECGVAYAKFSATRRHGRLSGETRCAVVSVFST